MKIWLIAAIFIAGSLAASAQEKVITAAEYSAAVSAAERSMYGGTHGPVRQSMETEVLNEGRPETDYRLKSLTLIVPGQGNHRMEDRSFGGKPSRSETISINKRSFSRDAAGTWKEIFPKAEASNEPPKSPAPAAQTADSQTEYKYLGTETYADHQVNTYLKTERKKTVNSATGTTSESDGITKVRIGVIGDYYRYESNSKTIANGKPGSVKVLIELVVDPTIKITAPETTDEAVKAIM
ncbi:hypothetical protein BH10ACI2_BH10ACI2_25870 [soil metagenome]